MIGWLYRALTAGLEPLVNPFLPADRRAAYPDTSGGAWIHAASAGEVRGIVTLAARLAAAGPVLITAQTPAGVAAATRLFPGAAVRRARFDFPGAAARAVREVRPALFLVAETELWPNLLDALESFQVPRVLVNGRISDRTIGRYRRLRSLLRPRLAGFSLIAAQSATDAARLRELGADPAAVLVLGNMKHDVPLGAVVPITLPWGSAPLLVAGSVRPGEFELLAAAFSPWLKEAAGPKLVVAPRHLRFAGAAARAFARRGCRVALRSASGPQPDDQVLVADSMGELLRYYAAARVALVGGTFRDYGGHNLIEPAALGVPVVHGPFTQNCRLEAEALATTGGSVRVEPTAAAILAACRRLIEHPAAHAAAAVGARGAVEPLARATDRVMAALAGRSLLPRPPRGAA